MITVEGDDMNLQMQQYARNGVQPRAERRAGEGYRPCGPDTDDLTNADIRMSFHRLPHPNDALRLLYELHEAYEAAGIDGETEAHVLPVLDRIHERYFTTRRARS